MTICSNLRANFDAAMAQNPPDLFHAAQTWDLMKQRGCEDMPPDPDPENQGGGHGPIEP